MTNTNRSLDNIAEESEPPPLSLTMHKRANSLNSLYEELRQVKKLGIPAYATKDEYDQSVSLCCKLPGDNANISTMIFKVYVDGNVADNSKYVCEERKGNKEYTLLRNFLKSMEFTTFHSHFLEYITERFRQTLDKKHL